MRIVVRVIPRSSRNRLTWEQDMLRARLTAPPVDGAANAALIELLAEQLDIPRRDISIVHGLTARQKTVEVANITLEEIIQKLQTSS
jgi:uncharacterized protein (TIGR00251 family)